MSQFVISLALTLLLAASKASSPAAPFEPTPEARATELKARGDAALIAGRPGDALKDYEEALRIKEDPALHYNKARALQALERFPEALHSLEKFVANASRELRSRVPRLDDLLVEIRGRSSALEVHSRVQGAEVRVGDQVVGETPLTRVELNAGTVTVTVKANGFHPLTRKVVLPPGGVAVVEAPLAPIATTGLLRVNSPVLGATMLLDGAPRGTLPFEDYLPIGSHTVELMAEGYDLSKHAIVVSAKQPRELKVDLRLTPKLYQRWYFWTAIAAVIAAGIVTTVALTVERPAAEGTLGITSVGK